MQPKRIGYGKGRIAFIAQMEQIKSLLQQGHTQKDIYESLQACLNGLSYSQFSMHVRKRILNNNAITLPSVISEQNPQPEKGTSSANQSHSSRRTKRFEPGPQTPDRSLLY